MSVTIRHLGVTDYAETWRAMQAFTLARNPETVDEIWLTEHPAVYSLGLNRKAARLPSRTDIPVIETDRGGKITYHGLGQLVVYVLLDLTRNQWTIRDVVNALEQSVIALLADANISAFLMPNAPGVYVHLPNEDLVSPDLANPTTAKIASLGLRIKNGCCYHGLSLNVDMDLSPFLAIDPCGYAGLAVTQTKDLGMVADMAQLREALVKKIVQNLLQSEQIV